MAHGKMTTREDTLVTASLPIHTEVTGVKFLFVLVDLVIYDSG